MYSSKGVSIWYQKKVINVRNNILINIDVLYPSLLKYFIAKKIYKQKYTHKIYGQVKNNNHLGSSPIRIELMKSKVISGTKEFITSFDLFILLL